MTGISIKVGLGDGMYFINPKEDITALEAAKLNIFLAYITVPRGFSYADPPEIRKDFLTEWWFC